MAERGFMALSLMVTEDDCKRLTAAVERARYWAGAGTQAQLAEEFGVSQQTLSNIISKTPFTCGDVL